MNSTRRLSKGKQTFLIKSKNPYEKIPEIPLIQLTKADMMKDPIELIAKLQQKYKEFGAVKIRACLEWQPPFSFKYTEKGITTRIQKIHKLSQGKVTLLNRWFSLENLLSFCWSLYRPFIKKFKSTTSSHSTTTRSNLKRTIDTDLAKREALWKAS